MHDSGQARQFRCPTLGMLLTLLHSSILPMPRAIKRMSIACLLLLLPISSSHAFRCGTMALSPNIAFAWLCVGALTNGCHLSWHQSYTTLVSLSTSGHYVTLLVHEGVTYVKGDHVQARRATTKDIACAECNAYLALWCLLGTTAVTLRQRPTWSPPLLPAQMRTLQLPHSLLHAQG